MSHHKCNHKPSPEPVTSKRTKRPTDFSKVGGLNNHIKILRETIIVPLMHYNVYSHFEVKTPRGVLFYGPPGTGKTLVAGALATELNKEGLGHVTFYQRKGGDVMDKWVGESEKKLRNLFENATKTRPSIIFFDELDGLAPIRSAKNDHVHCSIVTTLLALMDGLDSVPGVIVIGATNRIDFVDPALRRSGRFDKELYFPLPCAEGRKQILQVHMQSWPQKPSSHFLTHLAEMTAGFCGSDLQALCAEALLCAMQRQFPNVQNCPLGTKIKIEANEIKIEEADLLEATRNLAPVTHKRGCKSRKLSPVVAPLLQKQLNLILTRLRMLWPHFFAQFHKYVLGSDRYAGRVVLVGSNQQGLNTHLVPAILQGFEHLPVLFLDAATIQTPALFQNFCNNLPSILVMSRIDDLWNFLEISDQNYIVSVLEEGVHAGLPILIIASCDEELPLMLQNFFYNNTSLVITIEDPSEQEVEDFFVPLFFGDSSQSLSTVLKNKKSDKSGETSGSRWKRRNSEGCVCQLYKLKANGKINKPHANSTMRKPLRLHDKDLGRHHGESGERHRPDPGSVCTLCGPSEKRQRLSSILTELLQRSFRFLSRKKPQCQRTSSDRYVNLYEHFGDSDDVDKQKIFHLWRRTVAAVKDMPVAHLEVLYDTISACINLHKNSFENLIINLEETVNQIESAVSFD